MIGSIQPQIHCKYSDKNQVYQKHSHGMVINDFLFKENRDHSYGCCGVQPIIYPPLLWWQVRSITHCCGGHSHLDEHLMMPFVIGYHQSLKLIVGSPLSPSIVVASHLSPNVVVVWWSVMCPSMLWSAIWPQCCGL